MNSSVTPLRKKHIPLKKNPVYRFFKRAMDIFLSILGLILLSPLFAFVIIAIFIEDGAPAIYKQKRVGKGGKEFNIYKFRSMYRDADQIHERMKEEMGVTDISFKMSDKEDPRITKVGRFIRRTNIDELPQLINIIKGDIQSESDVNAEQKAELEGVVGLCEKININIFNNLTEVKINL